MWGVNFALIFLAEYGHILFISYIRVVIFGGGYLIEIIGIVIILIWVRGVYPRFRYDKLIDLNWKVFLPVVLILFYILFILKMLLL
ncbi:NADH-quinone oxidoreductase subunit H [Wolbachia endosymbiont of Corcyra cephalonica]|uniref:NADH-quinone oxidoreductase subunit H n=1 Tax=Wolbachia endosymbiont of Corcyra cephalonica TaxID=218111 RepID=UPI0034E1A29F